MKHLRLLLIVVGMVLFLAVPAISPAQDSTFARRIISDLSSPAMKGRGYASHGDRIAARYIRKQFRLLGLSPLGDNYFQKYRVDKSQVRNVYFPYRNAYHTQNVCAVLPGEIDSMVVFTAHYDHLGIDSEGVLYPGAHDNASGVSAVLELARMNTHIKPHYTLVFFLFSGEEAGLLGSHYAASHPLIDYSKVRLLVNIDMFCGGDEGFMIVNANSEKTAPFVERLTQYNEIHHLSPVISRRNNAPNSDHYYFSELCPAIFIYTLGGPHGDYHSPADTCPACGLSQFNDYLQLISLLAQPATRIGAE